MSFSPFHFKKFSVHQAGVAHPVGTDGVLLGAWADVANVQSILDIGTGSGLIALMLAQRTDNETRIHAIDVHQESLACALANFDQSSWKERITGEIISLQAFAKEHNRAFDLIVSNPPFFSETTVSSDKTRRIGRHTESLAPTELLVAIINLLKPNGKCCLVLPELEGRRFCEMAVPLGLYCTKELAIHARKEKPVERLLLQLERDPHRFEGRKLVISEKAGVYHSDYKALTSEFYLNF